jgi:beta-glucosidase/6-phospho-beta-glucosidase/beta-galactosidase
MIRTHIFSVKFGIFEVDYDDETRTRKPRASAFWFKDVMVARALKKDYKPNFKEMAF